MKIFPTRVLLVLVVILLTSAVYSQDFVRIANRESSRQHFTETFQNNEPAISWTGNSTTGDAGTTSAAFRTAVFAQINYFRCQAGVQPVVENLTYSSKAQQAAFLMSVNRRLDHYPTSEWTFYTTDAAEAAARSDLFLGVNGIKAIEGYIDDPGSNNARVGHRNWILRPETATMGTGDVPDNGGYSKANALWVVTSEYASRATRTPYNCWPPANGYTPYQVVYPRWSFKVPSGSLTNATVTMWNANGQSVPLTIDYQTSDSWYPLVWIPDIASSRYYQPRTAPPSDEWYRVRVSGIAGTAFSSVEYTVVIFDPAQVFPSNSFADLRISSSGENISVTWATPDASAWTLLESTDLASWVPSNAELEYDGFRVQARFQKVGMKKFFRLRE